MDGHPITKLSDVQGWIERKQGDATGADALALLMAHNSIETAIDLIQSLEAKSTDK